MTVPHRVIVSNIPFEASAEDVKRHFSSVGVVSDVQLHVLGNRFSRGVRVVDFMKQEDATAAERFLNRSVLGGRTILVRFANASDQPISHHTVPTHPWEQIRSPSLRDDDVLSRPEGPNHALLNLLAELCAQTTGRARGVPAAQFSGPEPFTTVHADGVDGSSVSCGQGTFGGVGVGDPLAGGMEFAVGADVGGNAPTPSVLMAAKPNRVFVLNLRFDVSWQDLKDHMRKIGPVVRADILTHADGSSKGSAVVEFVAEADARRAISELSGTELRGRKIFVREDRDGPAPASLPLRYVVPSTLPNAHAATTAVPANPSAAPSGSASLDWQVFPSAARGTQRVRQHPWQPLPTPPNAPPPHGPHAQGGMYGVPGPRHVSESMCPRISVSSQNVSTLPMSPSWPPLEGSPRRSRPSCTSSVSAVPFTGVPGHSSRSPSFVEGSGAMVTGSLVHLNAGALTDGVNSTSERVVHPFFPVPQISSDAANTVQDAANNLYPANANATLQGEGTSGSPNPLLAALQTAMGTLQGDTSSAAPQTTPSLAGLGGSTDTSHDQSDQARAGADQIRSPASANDSHSPADALTQLIALVGLPAVMSLLGDSNGMPPDPSVPPTDVASATADIPPQPRSTDTSASFSGSLR
eukprot:TRINITY_DN5418_c0_g4_i1.p1 TRINITY_DN5418_c0_g4~~TRINITY_DN5418_c0_g4_i1.p1  ORF type:complete len:637 (+),score=25.96 TRINITY_DN5418_c0_g4_i1:237-2147(+)